MPNPRFDEVLRRMKAIHDRKSHDYARASNPYSNFEYAAAVLAPFTDPTDQIFAGLIGVKLARLAELRAGKVPLNESVADSLLDLATYASIWASYLAAPEPPASYLSDPLAGRGGE